MIVMCSKLYNKNMAYVEIRGGGDICVNKEKSLKINEILSSCPPFYSICAMSKRENANN